MFQLVTDHVYFENECVEVDCHVKELYFREMGIHSSYALFVSGWSGRKFTLFEID